MSIFKRKTESAPILSEVQISHMRPDGTTTVASLKGVYDFSYDDSHFFFFDADDRVLGAFPRPFTVVTAVTE